MNKIKHSYLICFLSGLVTALPLLLTALWPLTWLSILPLFYLAPRVRNRYLHGLCFGMGFYLPVYYWFIKLYPMDFVGFTPVEGAITVVICWLGLALLQASEMAFIPMVYARLMPKLPHRASLALLGGLLAASCFTVFEWVQSLFWHGVPWGRLALTQIGFLPMVQSASLLGSMFICFLIVLVNGALACLLPLILPRFRKESGARRRLMALLPALLLLLIPLTNGIYGALRMRMLDERISDAPQVKVALIQGNIASGDKWNNWTTGKCVEHYLTLSAEAIEAGDPDIILWPETVVTTSLSYESNYTWKLKDFAKEHGVMLVVGAYADDDEGNRYNALFAFRPDGERDETVYAKRHLVPFGEYLPMAWLFEQIPFLAELNLSASALTPGEDSALFETEWGKIGGLVCFDSIYDSLARQSTTDGASLILLSTNDSWYRDSHAIWQHNAHACLRAIENGRAIGRAANTGTSTLILPNGEVTDSLPPLVTGTIVGSLPLMEISTLYQSVGNLIVCLCIALLCGRALHLVIPALMKRK